MGDDLPRLLLVLGVSPSSKEASQADHDRLNKRPKLVTTDGEFHTMRRRFDRLAEEGTEIIKVPAMPATTLAERLVISVDDRTAAVLVSGGAALQFTHRAESPGDARGV